MDVKDLNRAKMRYIKSKNTEDSIIRSNIVPLFLGAVLRDLPILSDSDITTKVTHILTSLDNWFGMEEPPTINHIPVQNTMHPSRHTLRHIVNHITTLNSSMVYHLITEDGVVNNLIRYAMHVRSLYFLNKNISLLGSMGETEIKELLGGKEKGSKDGEYFSLFFTEIVKSPIRSITDDIETYGESIYGLVRIKPQGDLGAYMSEFIRNPLLQVKSTETLHLYVASSLINVYPYISTPEGGVCNARLVAILLHLIDEYAMLESRYDYIDV